MTENDPQDATPTEAPTDQADNTEGYVFAVPADRSDDDGAKGYAVYNQLLGQFLPGVHESKADATKAAKALDYLHVVKV